MTMRRLSLFAVAMSIVACTRNHACRDKTLFLQLDWPTSIAAADSFVVSIGVDGGTRRRMTIPHGSGDGSSLEIDFKAYPAGKNVTLNVDALRGQTFIAGLSGVVQMTGTCVATILSKNGTRPNDMGVGDTGVAVDLSTRDGMIGDGASVGATPDMANEVCATEGMIRCKSQNHSFQQA